MIFTREWLKEHYIDKRMSASQVAELAKCHVDTVYFYVRLWGLRKRDGRRRWSGKTNFIPATKGKRQSIGERQKKRISQPHRKAVVAIAPDGQEMRYDSITDAANKTGVSRENIRAVLHGKRNRAGGYEWRYDRAYGEELVHRKESIDMRLPMEKIVSRIYRNLPKRMPANEAAIYYTKKLRKCWERL
jgi:hypothetical protein